MGHEYAAEWFEYADMDLNTAEHLLTLHPQPLGIICFHCQQAAEKYLKGFLVLSEEVEPPKTHDLVLLQITCMKTNGSFHSIGRACEVLTRYGVQPRYPNEIEITEKDMQKAIEYARQIRDFEILAEIRKEISQSTD